MGNIPRMIPREQTSAARLSSFFIFFDFNRIETNFLNFKMVLKIETKDEFHKFLKDAGDKLVVVDFTATWCGPCKMIGPKFEAMAAEYKEICCCKVDVDDNAETAEFCGISAMPTFKAYKNEQQVDEIVGASEDKLRAMIEKNK